VTAVEPPRLAHHRRGSGEPLLLLHGIGHSWRAWTPVLDELERHLDVLAVDLPGYGSSPPLPPGVRHTPEALADAVERDLLAQGVETVHIAGNSLGGRIALELARRGRARSVVALSPSGMWTSREFAYSRALLIVTRLGARVAPPAGHLYRWAPLRTLLLGHLYGRPWRLDPNQVGEDTRLLAASPALMETLDSPENRRPPPGLDRIACPVLIAWGTRDRLLLPRQALRFVRVIPGAELRRLPGAGHIAMSDDPELVARTITDWVERAAGARPRPEPHAAAPG
jgi:pimeloyl-ACP methyl ester carboxylesterase